MTVLYDSLGSYDQLFAKSAISVFGIYTHAQMGHASFWNTLSRQLENKGPEFIARCTFRNKPLNTGDNVVLPASFPQLPTQEVQEIVPLVRDCEEDLKNVRERFCCENSVSAHINSLNVQIHSMLV